MQLYDENSASRASLKQIPGVQTFNYASAILFFFFLTPLLQKSSQKITPVFLGHFSVQIKRASYL